MAIKKVFNSKYTQTPNDILNHPGLSFKAKGIWGYLNSKPESWDYSVRGATSQSKDGKDAVSSGMKELEEMKYLKRIPKKNQLGEFCGSDYILFDEPFSEDEESEDGFSKDGKQGDQSNKEGSKKEEVKPTQGLFGKEPDPKAKVLFKNCIYKDFNIFKVKLKEADFLGIDLQYYHRAVDRWSRSKTVKRSADGWIATVEGFMETDKDNGKLRMARSDDEIENENDEAKEYLKM